MSKWTDEEVSEVLLDFRDYDGCTEVCALGRALLDAREQVATLKAEVRAWRAWWLAWHSRDDGVLPIAEANALGVVRAATDALFKEGL